MNKQNRNDFVISGISGRYPESDNIYEYWDAIVNGVELTSEDDRRWPVGFMDLPPRSGKVKNAHKCDAEFFKLTFDDTNFMDPQVRIFYEVAYEAMIDAGRIPEDLRGSNTAVTVALCYDDTSQVFSRDIPRRNATTRQLIRQKSGEISHHFGFTGPSFELDTACAGSFSALFEGIQMMKAGLADKLLVGGYALQLIPNASRGLLDISMIAPDGRSKCLDASANGFCRSEAVAALFVEKRKDAKRIYASVKAIDTNTDGFKSEGVTFPGYKTQKDLMLRTIQNSGVDPLKIRYIEAHITGTPAGDTTETRSILDSYRKDNKEAIMFGCLKSNIGHTEAASSVSAITKVALIFQKHCIPPNLNFKTQSPNIPGLVSGQIIPVIEKMEFHDEIIPVNSFGIGGVNVHGLLQANEKIVNKDSFKIIDTIPRLVNITGRTEEGLEYAMNWIESNRKDVTKDFLGLLSDVSKIRLETGMHCRAFMILEETKTLQKRVFREDKRRPLYLMFSVLGSQLQATARQLMSFPGFTESIRKCANVLDSVGIDLIGLLINKCADTDSNVISNILMNVSIQIAIMDLLHFVGIKPDRIVGYSIGEVVAGYADGCITLEQAVMTAYYIARCSKDCSRENNATAMVGLSWEKMSSRCPVGVYITHDISENEVIVSGPRDRIIAFANELKDESISVEEMEDCEIAFHSPLLKPCLQTLATKLKEVIKFLKVTSHRFISSSSREHPSSLILDSKYYANIVASPVLFTDVVSTVPENACIVQIGCSASLLSTLSRCCPSAQIVSLIEDNGENSVENVLSAIGQIYCSGNNVNIEHLYPKFEYPVPRETLSLSHLLKWDHSKSYLVVTFNEFCIKNMSSVTKEINFIGKEWKFIDGHNVDGRVLFPATGYLYLVLLQFTELKSKKSEFTFPVEFKNVRFQRAVIVPTSGTVDFRICIDESTGRFAVTESGSECITGAICVADDEDFCFQQTQNEERKPEKTVLLEKDDIYRELRLRGYDYGPTFQGLVEAESDGSRGKVTWTGHWVSFVDSMLHLTILSTNERSLRVPTGLDFMRFDPKMFYKAIETNESVQVFYDKEANIGFTDGIFIRSLKGTAIQRRSDNQMPRLMKQYFSPYFENVTTSEIKVNEIEEYFQKCSKLLKKVVTNELMLDESDESCKFNTSFKEEFAFYKRLVSAIKGKVDFNRFPDYIAASDKTSPLFKSNFEDILGTQIKQATENLPQSINVVEFNETECKVKTSLDVNSIFIHKFNYHSLPDRQSSIEMPSTLTDVDLIIHKDASLELVTDQKSLKDLEQISSLIDSFYKSLKSGGFLLFAYRNKLTELEDELIRLQGLSFRLLDERSLLSIFELKFNLIGKRSDDLGIVSFILKKVEEPKPVIIVKPEFENFEWVESLKNQLQEESVEKTIWLLSKESDFHGVLGLVRCLKRESFDNIRCFVSNEQSIPEYILKKDLVMNFFKNGLFGAYIHQDIQEEMKEVEHSYLDVKTKGDLSSIQWYEAPHKHWSQLNDNQKTGPLVHIYYGALNFKDVLIATGRIPLNAYPEGVYSAGSLGFEYSGIDENGNRVMGIVNTNCLATSVVADRNITWRVPDQWTLEEAATVPSVYCTVYYSLIVRGKLIEKEKVLIHAGSGGVGFGAIVVCLAMGCEVFTSVGTEEKKQFLKSQFPQLEDRHIVNSRDTTFEEHILKETNGHGVDVILNSLAEEKLRASIRCLAEFGRFVEIGKYDIVQDTEFDWSLFATNQTLHVISMAHFNQITSNSELKRLEQLRVLMDDAVNKGHVKPLKATVFKSNEAEEAFRFMAAGKHIGKVVIKIREEQDSFRSMMLKSYAQTYCHPSKVYVIFGGLGGLGLEVALWLSLRGAKKLVITTRTGLKNNYQRAMVNKLLDKGVIVKVVVNDASSYELTMNVMNESLVLGPIGGVFNLSLVLNDDLFCNQTVETFRKVCLPKINTSLHLDQITRRVCPDLDYFVCFSSMTCGMGVKGQSNYGFANSVMESICEKRREDNLHAVAIQWGPVGDTGYFYDLCKLNDVVVKSCVPQRVPSFLNTLNVLMNSNYAVCTSVVSETKLASKLGQKDELLKVICYILGFNDPSTLEDSKTLGELGIDSLMAVEIQQGLDREYNMVLSAQEIRQLTIKDIKEISANKKVDKGTLLNETVEVNPFKLSKELFFNLDNGNQGVPVFIVPPILGGFQQLQPLVKYITRPVVAINWTEEVNEKESIEDVAAFYIEKLREKYEQTEYEFIAYSFGSFVAFEMCLQLQAINVRLVRKLILLDGDFPTIKLSLAKIQKEIDQKGENGAYRELLLAFMAVTRPREEIENLKSQLIALNSKEEFLALTVQFINSVSKIECDIQMLSSAVQVYVDKVKRAVNYQPKTKFVGEATLIFSSEMNETLQLNDATHNELKKLVKRDIELVRKKGDHTTFLTTNYEEIGNSIESQLLRVYC